LFALICAAGIILGAPAGAQTTAPLAPYVLAPGDVIRIVVEGLPDYSANEVLIRPDGQINLPIYNTVDCAGKTVSALQAELRKIVSTRLLRPERLTVTLIRPRVPVPSFASVIGSGIRVPTRVDVGENGMRLTTILAAVGGAQGRLEEVEGYLARLGKSQIKVDLFTAMTDPSSKSNIFVMRGDVLTVNQVDPSSITLQGDVIRPGVYLMRRVPNPSANAYDIPLAPKLTDLLLSAGGLKYPSPVDKDLEFNGFVLRDNKKIPIRVLNALNYLEEAANLPLLPKDIVNITAVIVPPVIVTISGGVRSTGKLTLKPGTGIVEAIAQAGGLTDEIGKFVITVNRDGKSIPIDLYKAIVSNDPVANVKLETDDIIQVLETKRIQVQVTGRVARSGLLRVEPGTQLITVLNQAGNPIVKYDNARTQILRTLPGGKQIRLDIDTNGLFNLEAAQNPTMQDNDIVSVTEVIPPEPEDIKRTVYITGEVARQGSYDLSDGEGLTEVIARAGGVTDKAALTRVQRQRVGESPKTIDMLTALTKGTETVREELIRGDFIIVPRNTNRVVVMDAVNKPGDVTIPEKGQLTVLDAINAAGGWKLNAKTAEIAIYRYTPQGLTEIKVAIVKGVASTRIPLQPDDVVYVPPGKVPPSFMSKIAPLLAGIGILNGFGN